MGKGIGRFAAVTISLLCAACVTSPATTPATLTVTPRVVSTSTVQLIQASDLTSTQLAENIRIATATIGARQTVAALTRTPVPSRTMAPPTATSTVTPTADYSVIVTTWAKYRFEVAGFEAEYPLLYSYPPLSEAQCAPSDGVWGGHVEANIGHRIWITVLPAASGVTPRSLADEFVGDGSEVRNAGISEILIGGEPASRTTYRFGLTNRYGDMSFVVHNSRIYRISFTAGAFCDYFENGLYGPSELDAYERLLATWEFID